VLDHVALEAILIDMMILRENKERRLWPISRHSQTLPPS